MTTNMSYSPNVMHNAAQVCGKGISEPQRKHYAAAADWLERNIAQQLAEGWPEILDTAKKNSHGGEKPSSASVTFSVHFDLSNIELLNAEVGMSLAPFKLKLEASTSEDLNQLTLNFETGSVTKADDAPGTGPRSLHWDALTELQREAACDAFGDECAHEAEYVFQGVLCVEQRLPDGTSNLPGGEEEQKNTEPEPEDWRFMADAECPQPGDQVLRAGLWDEVYGDGDDESSTLTVQELRDSLSDNDLRFRTTRPLPEGSDTPGAPIAAPTREQMLEMNKSELRAIAHEKDVKLLARDTVEQMADKILAAGE